jgi:hypothetical protein
MLFLVFFTLLHETCCGHLIEYGGVSKLSVNTFIPYTLCWNLCSQEQEKRAQTILARREFLEAKGGEKCNKLFSINKALILQKIGRSERKVLGFLDVLQLSDLLFKKWVSMA